METARHVGEELALLGCSGSGMEMTMAVIKLESAPPAEFLERLIRWPHTQAS